MKKLNYFLLTFILLFSLTTNTGIVSAKIVTKPKTTKKVQVVKKPIATKKSITTKTTKKMVSKKYSATKNIPMNQLPNPNSASSPAMKLYLQTINNARLIFKKEQVAAKTKEDKQAAEDKYALAVQDAMDLLNNAKKTDQQTSSDTTSTPSL